MSSQKVCSCNTWTLPQYLFFFLFLWCYHQLIEVKKLGNKLTSFHVWDNDVLEAKISCINLDVIFTASKNWKWRQRVPLFFMKNLHPPPSSYKCIWNWNFGHFHNFTTFIMHVHHGFHWTDKKNDIPAQNWI